MGEAADRLPHAKIVSRIVFALQFGSQGIEKIVVTLDRRPGGIIQIAGHEGTNEAPTKCIFNAMTYFPPEARSVTAPAGAEQP